MQKPEIRKRDYYDYSELATYLEQKHGVNLNDFAGRRKETDRDRLDKIPYQNFWHWLVDIADIRNGSMFYMPDADCYVTLPDWVVTIIGWFNEEWPDLDEVPLVASW